MIGRAIQKDVLLLLRDRGAVVSLFLLPIVFIVAFGSMLRFGPDSGQPRTIAVWHAGGDPRGQAIARAVDDTLGFVVRPVESGDVARRLVADEQVSAALIVPTEPARPVELSIDQAVPVQVRGPVQAALFAAVLRATSPQLFATVPPIEIVSPPGLGKPLANISSFQVTVPGNAVLFGFFIALTVAMAFAGERKSGTWRRLLAAPVPRWKALVATLVPYFLVGVVQLAFLFGVGIVAFGMQVAGSSVALVVLSLAVVCCAVSLGLLMAAIGGSEKQLGGVGSVLLLVMGMLGGCMIPRMVMPEFMQQLGLAVPHAWALDGYYDVLVREGTSLLDIAPSVGALLAFAAGFTALGLSLFRFER